MQYMTAAREKKEDVRATPEQPARHQTKAAAHNKADSAAVYKHLQIKYSLQIIQTRHKKEELLQLPFAFLY